MCQFLDRNRMIVQKTTTTPGDLMFSRGRLESIISTPEDVPSSRKKNFRNLQKYAFLVETPMMRDLTDEGEAGGGLLVTEGQTHAVLVSLLFKSLKYLKRIEEVEAEDVTEKRKSSSNP